MSFILDRFKIEHDHFKNQKSRKIKHRSMKSAQQFLESIPYEYDRK